MTLPRPPHFVTVLSLVSFLMGGFCGLYPETAGATAILKANCYVQDKDGRQLQGVNVDEMYPIASVSKVLTSYWAIRKMGPGGRFPTRFHLAKISDGLYDVHIEGLHDPYFGKPVLQFVVSELNALGVNRIRHLSFDENFKYLNDTTEHVSIAHFNNDEPSPPRVRAELRSGLDGLVRNYNLLKVKARDRRGMQLPVKIQLKVESIEFKPSDEVNLGGFESSYVYHSTELSEVLKEMNRNSNNHAANQIFESLGGPQEFAHFMAREGFDLNQVRFYNGSGDRKDFAGGAIAYNQASCRSVVRVVQKLCSSLRGSGLDLQQVLSVAGRQPPGERGTVEMYNNDDTAGALIAKTGTVDPAITLAGMMSTDEGEIFFGYIYKTDGGSDWRVARDKIRGAVTDLLHQFGGAEPINYSAQSFLAFDQNSHLELENPAALR